MNYSSGLYLELASNKIGYAPPWMITDETKTPDSVPIKERKQYRKGTLHEARICQFNRMDGVAILSLQRSVLDKPYMKYSDVQVGDCVSGVVEKVCPFGMIISVTEAIRGLCPRIHVSDTKTITLKPSKKYKEGSKVNCRVVNVDPVHKRLLLTCKKSLVQESGEILAEYTSAEAGACHRGVVTSVHPYGCIVHFFGRVRGIVRKSELGAVAKTFSDPALEFWPGQPVECRVLECEAAAQRLLLSLVLRPSEAEAAVGDSGEVLGSGDVVEGEVMGIASNGITLKSPLTGEAMFLPTLHLSDYPHHCSVLLSIHQTALEKALRESK